jgi:predicted nucleic acid-binding protein
LVVTTALKQRWPIHSPRRGGKFLELAVSGHADCILTGDADLLVLNPFRGISIVNPATFVQGASR